MWEQYPGAANGGTAAHGRPDAVPEPRARRTCPARTRTPGPTSTTTTLPNIGPDGHIVPSTRRTRRGGAPHRRRRNFVYPFTRLHAGTRRGVRPARKCSWNCDDREQLADQPRADHGPGLLLRQPLPRPPAAAPIAFSVVRRQLRGRRPRPGQRRRRRGTLGQPPDRHTDNAYMDTPPDGAPPTMAMFLFFNDAQQPVPRRQRRRRRRDRLPRVHARPLEPARDDSAGRRDALNGAAGRARWARPGATGTRRTSSSGSSPPTTRPPTATSTWASTPTAMPALDPHAGRSTARSAPAASQCPGADGCAGAGGYTYGDFGKIDASAPRCTPTARSGRETLWDLRTAVGSAGRGGDRHPGHAPLAARADVPRRARRDPRRRPAAVPRRRPQRRDLGGVRTRGMGWTPLPDGTRSSRASSPPPRRGSRRRRRPGAARHPRRVGPSDADGTVVSLRLRLRRWRHPASDAHPRRPTPTRRRGPTTRPSPCTTTRAGRTPRRGAST